MIAGIACLFHLQDHPRDARWLPPGEQRALIEALAREGRKSGPGASDMLRQVPLLLRSPFVVVNAFVYKREFDRGPCHGADTGSQLSRKEEG